MSTFDHGELLSGGNTTEVRRLGNTVRRAAGEWTPAVHALLHHLEAVGFAGSPRVVGVEDGWEVLGFVAGEVGTLSPEQPLGAWFRGDEACWAVGRWIREFQLATASFQPDPALPWRRAPGTDLGDGQVIVHHDVSPYNAVHTDADELVILDWDFCRPGDRLQDVAWAAWRWVPLMAGTWWHQEYGLDADVEGWQQSHLLALLDGYGATRDDRETLVDLISQEITQHAVDLEDMAASDPAFASLIERGYARAAREDAAWWGNTTLLGEYRC